MSLFAKFDVSRAKLDVYYLIVFYVHKYYSIAAADSPLQFLMLDLARYSFGGELGFVFLDPSLLFG